MVVDFEEVDFEDIDFEDPRCALQTGSHVARSARALRASEVHERQLSSPPRSLARQSNGAHSQAKYTAAGVRRMPSTDAAVRQIWSVRRNYARTHHAGC